MAADSPGAYWDAYWRGMYQASAFGAGGVLEGALDRFWQGLFAGPCSSATHPRLLDLACGHGAVARHAIAAAQTGGRPQPAIHGLDISAAAILELRKNVPALLGVAASAAKTPFAAGSFDVVASQFGVEYAGLEAFGEAARLVAPGGVLAAVFHMRDGGIHRECARNLEVATRILDGGVLEHARAAFAAGFAARDGRGPMSEFEKASAAMVPAVRGLGDLMRQYGENVASGTAKSLYNDLAHMYRRLSAYDEREVSDWIDGMEREITMYIGRMSSMTRAAVGETELAQIVAQITKQGLRVGEQREMRLDRLPEPAAWILVAHTD